MVLWTEKVSIQSLGKGNIILVTSNMLTLGYEEKKISEVETKSSSHSEHWHHSVISKLQELTFNRSLKLETSLTFLDVNNRVLSI